MISQAPPEVARRPVLINVIVARGHLDAELLVTPDLAGFAGHFPDFPILPGVVQVDWAVHFAQEYLQLDEPVVRVERLKFTCPISPNTSLRVSLSYDADKSSVDFRFYRPLNAASHSNHANHDASHDARSDAPASRAGAKELLFSQGRLIYFREPASS